MQLYGTLAGVSVLLAADSTMPTGTVRLHPKTLAELVSGPTKTQSTPTAAVTTRRKRKRLSAARIAYETPTPAQLAKLAKLEGRDRTIAEALLLNGKSGTAVGRSVGLHFTTISVIRKRLEQQLGLVRVAG